MKRTIQFLIIAAIVACRSLPSDSPASGSGRAPILGFIPTNGPYLPGQQSGGGGAGNTAGANVVPVSLGAGSGFGSSTITDSGGGSSGQVVFTGSGTLSTGIVRIDNASVGTTQQLDVVETDTGHTADEAINVVLRQEATFDTTSGTATAEGVDIGCSSSRVAGTNPLTNQCVLISVSNGDTNVALQALGGPIGSNDGVFSTGGASSIVSLTVPSGVFDASGTSSASLGVHVLPFQLPGSSTVTPEVDLGLALHDGTNLQMKNTIPGDNFSGIDIGGDTTVNATAQPGVFFSRGAGGGGGLAGSASSSIMMSGNTNGGMVGTVANDLLLYNISGNGIVFGADSATFTTATRLTNKNHYVALTSTGKPTLDAGTCGVGGSQTIVGNDNRFQILTGAASTTCTIGFVSTWTVAPMCTITPIGQPVVPTCVPSATQIVCSVNIAASRYVFDCQGQQGST